MKPRTSTDTQFALPRPDSGTVRGKKQPMSNNHTILIVLVLVCGSMCLASCGHLTLLTSPRSPLSPPPMDTPPQPSTLLPTLTPTLMPSTATATPTEMTQPTQTPLPPATPTLLPNPTLPPEIITPQTYPALPADLYFIRDGSLWRWPKEGKELHPVVHEPQAIQVSAYQLTPNGRYLVYTFFDLTSQRAVRNMRVLDQLTGKSFLIFPTGDPGDFTITPDGRYVIYLAWGVRPTISAKTSGWSHLSPAQNPGGNQYGTLLAVEVQNINREYELGYCTSHTEYEWELHCDGFALSPDGTKIAFSDGRGMWLSEVPQGMPRLIAPHLYHSNFCGVWHMRDWSPDGKYLLVDVGCFEGGYSALMDVDTGEAQEIPHTWSYPNAYVRTSWSRDGEGLLVNQINFESGNGTAYLFEVPTANPGQMTMIISATWPGAVWPTEPYELSTGRIGFLNQQCLDSQGMKPGVYTIGENDSLEFISPLPAMPCYVSENIRQTWGISVWSPEGTAYLYLAQDDQRPLLLGRIDRPAIWDVRELLANAYNFRWQPSGTSQR